MPDHDNLREIKSFPSLVKYLRDELDWPIEAEDFEDLTFDYEPEELGIDAKTAAKIEQIKQLRPLVSNQPWGIFFVKFEPKRLPVMALRRILSRLVIKKRTSAKKSDQPSWHLHDLLFISNYGEGEQRQITFAHFAQDETMGDLPTLKVLGWDDADTALHIDHAHQELKEKLHWQEDNEKISDWRSRWSSLFTLRHREVITTSKALSERLAKLAADIRKRVNTILRLETDKGPIRKLQTDFKTALIHDLSDDDFADMYAQTITYGLLTARVSRPAGLVVENITDMVPVTNPFLRDLMSTFLTIGGRKGKVDFDEVGINDVVQTLREANMEAVLRDFGDRKPEEDPVIFFYEDFLKAYDKKKKVQKGVFYTPKPVVSYIVRSVHELLQKEFKLEDGLADTTTWGEMVKKFPSQEEGNPGLQIPSGTSPEAPFVQILDPATGTGTFLVEVIEVIFRTLTTKWKQWGLSREQQQTAWNDYVPKHLLPRLHGYELMMAPYAIAHMKIGLKLYETGYRFGSNERARIYLTNALEPPTDIGQLLIFSEALAHEGQAVNVIKRDKRFTIVIGNPPYSKLSGNLGPNAVALIEPFRFVDGERIIERGALALELNLQDDYVKFWGLLAKYIKESGVGVASFITNSRYLASRSLRGLRWNLKTNFSQGFFLDLGGQVSERRAGGIVDENVFEIEQGVSVGLLMRQPDKRLMQTVWVEQIIGSRTKKYNYLESTTTFHLETEINLKAPFFKFLHNNYVEEEFDSWPTLEEIMPHNSGCIITSRDNLALDFDKDRLLSKIDKFARTEVGDKSIEKEIGFSCKAKWDVEACKLSILSTKNRAKIVHQILYRPFDLRWIYYSTSLLDTPSKPVCDSIFGHENFVLLTPRINTMNDFSHVIVSDVPAEKKSCSHDRATQMFPLFRYDGDLQTVNFTPQFVKELQSTGLSSVPATAIFCYIYALLYSQEYRSRYAGSLRDSYPRIPMTKNLELFGVLGKIGSKLVSLHLLKFSMLDKQLSNWLGKTPSCEIEKVTYSDETVWIDNANSEGFRVISEKVWNFHIGGYQVCHKWLKDRKGRRLSKDDIEHYQRIVVALNETIRLMSEIDIVINAHGGWPNAFQTSSGADSKTYETEPFEYLKAAEEHDDFNKERK